MASERVKPDMIDQHGSKTRRYYSVSTILRVIDEEVARWKDGADWVKVAALRDLRARFEEADNDA